MQVVTDSAANLTPDQLQELGVHSIPLSLTLNGKNYLSGVDLQPAEFYTLLEGTDSFPTTSQPSAGEFAVLYRQLVEDRLH